MSGGPLWVPRCYRASLRNCARVAARSGKSIRAQRKDGSFVHSKEPLEQLLRRINTHQSLGTIVLLQPRRIGPEHRSPSKRERTIQHSGHSSSGFGKHKEQLQWNSVHSRRCVAISARRQARRRGKNHFYPGCFSGWREQAGRRIADEVGQGCGSVRQWPGR